MVSIYKSNDKQFIVYRRNTKGEIITTKPQEMIFTVKPKLGTSQISIEKRIGAGIEQAEDGGWIISVESYDTQNMRVTEEKLVLVCDVKIIDEYGNNVTIVKPQDFVVLPVVTN